MKRIITIIVVGAIIILGITIQLKRNHEKINKARPNSGISNVVNVNVAKVTEKGTGNELNLTGTLYPIIELNISAQAQGQITSLDIELGEHKYKGALIATIDNRLKQLAFDDAKLNESKLKRNLERIHNLYNGGSATEQQLDDARNAYESAKIQLEQAKKQLSDATIEAPFSGVIMQKFVEKGSFINLGSPIASIINISKLKVKINASESNIYKIKTGNQAIVTTDVYHGTEFSGYVTFVSDRGDESHNYAMEVEIPNNKQHPLKAGTFVNVKIKVPGTAKALFIPREALVGSTQDASVYIAKNGKAILKKITVKNNAGSDLQILSGLTEGDEIIVTGQINLVDGKEINVVEN
ncbi:MAG: efflux RND transporter periplasmic adaptor subunit [Labilibaculum sp.]|nr:efflux RND transporter periplasmic adaptor subunit [Labilibaculum sp.]